LKLLLESTDKEPLTLAQIAELKAALTEYQALIKGEKENIEKAKKQEAARKEAAKTKILEVTLRKTVQPR